MFAFADKDGDGQLSYEEFEVGMFKGNKQKTCGKTTSLKIERKETCAYGVETWNCAPR